MTEHDQERIIDGLVALAMQYPRFDLTDDIQVRYVTQLSDLPVEAVLAAIDRAGLVNTFFPSVSEIRAEVTHMAVGYETAETAWIEVRAEAKRIGHNRPPVFQGGEFVERPKPVFSSPRIAQAVASVGWNRICTSDGAREDFIWAYKGLERRDSAAVQRGDLEALTGLPYGTDPALPDETPREWTTKPQPWRSAR